MAEAGSAATAGGDAFAAAHAALLRHRELQFDFPPADPPRPPPVLQPLPEWLFALLQLLGQGLKYLFWAGLALAAAAVVFLVGRELMRLRRPARRPAPAPEDWRPDATAARALLDEADRLAAEGLYEEAAHRLLFRSIEDISARRPALVRPALTSRDIAAAEGLPSAARAAFGRIAEAVERSFFGGRPLGAAEFAACRAAYERFAFATEALA